jgi:Polyketide cyclase / dehydrase and lipid transport
MHAASRFRLVASALALGALIAAAPAQASTPDPDATRISTAGHSLKWNWTPPGRAQRFGHAETLIHAPLAEVRRLVLDFGRYKEMAPSITTSRVVGHAPDGSTDVYLRMGVLNNTLTFWNVTRFAPLRVAPDGNELVEGQMVHGKGNVDDSAAVWTLRPVGAGWTVLKFDVLLNPGVPAPQSLIDEQLRDSAMDVVNSIHDRVQGSKDILPYAG